MENYSLSDIASVSNGNAFGGNSSWLIILFFVIFGIFGGAGWNRQGDFGQYATASSQQEILFGQQFQNLDNKMDRLGNGIADSTFALNNTIVNEGRNVQTHICETNKNIDSVKLDMANYVASINATSTANTQKILDVLTTNRMAEMQNQINALQMQNAMCGVVRYPTASTYNAGGNPFCNCNCNCSNI